jgi:Holliday junction resolvase RusA-like endonuclease
VYIYIHHTLYTRQEPKNTNTEITMIYEIIEGQVIAKSNNYMVADSGGSRHIIKNEAIRNYERSFDAQCRIYRDRHIDSRFTLYIDVWHGSSRFDLDNSIKTVLDCLQYAGAITNDSLCCSIVAHKYVDSKRPRIRYAIEEESYSLFK